MAEKIHKKEKFVGIFLDHFLFFVKNVPCLRNLNALWRRYDKVFFVKKKLQKKYWAFQLSSNIKIANMMDLQKWKGKEINLHTMAICRNLNFDDAVSQQKNLVRNKTCVPSMIHSARPTVPPVVITILAWKLFCLARFWKVGTDVQTTRAKIGITTVRDCWSATWIKKEQILKKDRPSFLTWSNWQLSSNYDFPNFSYRLRNLVSVC